jgi:hypothetical protein
LPVDADLSALATPEGVALANVLKQVLREVHFDQVNHDLRLPQYGGDYDIRPFPLPVSPVDVQNMKVRLRAAVKTSRATEEATLARRIRQAFAFFMFGESLSPQALEELFGKDRQASIEAGLRLGLFIDATGGTIRMNGLSVLSRRLPNGDVMYVLADTPPHFAAQAAHQRREGSGSPSRIAGTARVYIGADSYELMERVSAISAISAYCVEMGSGSGIQLITALKQHPAISKAIGIERETRAIHVSLFNAALNGAVEKMVVVDDERGLHIALNGHRVSFAMMNPPFIAMPEWIDIDAEDRPALSTLMDIRETGSGFQGNLRTIFPEAGWGGEAGLDVTKQFLQTLFPLLAPQSQTIIYSQFAGDEQGPTLLRDYVQTIGGFSFGFEPAQSGAIAVMDPQSSRVVEGRSQTVFRIDEAAVSVARLIVAALMARQDETRLRVMIRKGGLEHAWLVKFAQRIEETYGRLGIKHFHDGFVVLTRR